MDTRASNRLKELLLKSVEEFCESEETGEPTWMQSSTFHSITAHITKQFGSYSHEPIVEYMFSLYRCAGKANAVDANGKIDVTSPETVARICEELTAYWFSIPRKYLVTFPLTLSTPAQLGFETAQLAPGISLGAAQVPTPDKIHPGFLGSLNALAHPSSATTTVTALKIETKGIVTVGNADEPALSMAFRNCKVICTLAEVLDALVYSTENSSFGGQATIVCLDDPTERVTMSLPSSLLGKMGRLVPATLSLARTALQVSAMTGKPGVIPAAGIGDALVSRLKKAGNAIQRAHIHVECKNNKASKDQRTLEEKAFDEHASKIVTAAEWLFNAKGDSSRAMAYVQLSIGFEALYGGTKDEPVVQTLANRVSHSLARTAAERGDLHKKFVDFYNRRSEIVHSGASRLTAGDAELFGWGESTLHRALRHELGLMKPSIPTD